MRSIWLVIALGAVPFLMAADAPKGPPEGWKEYTPSDKSFTVWLPEGGRRSERTRDFIVQGHRGRVNAVHLQANDGPTYSAATLRISSTAFMRVRMNERVEMMRDFFLDEFKGKVTKESDLKQGRVPGKDYLIETEKKGLIRLHVYVAGAIIYEAHVQGTKEQLESKDAKTFLDSYRLPERATNPMADKPADTVPDTTPSRKPAGNKTPLTKAEWTRLQADVNSADPTRRTAVYRRLAEAAPDDDRRAGVVALQEKGLSDLWPDARQAAARGLALWQGAKAIPTLVKTLDGLDPLLHGVILDALAAMQDDEAAKAIAKRILDIHDRAKATTALKKLEPARAEKALLPLLDSADVFNKKEIAKLLGAVGGKDSMGPLEKLAGENNQFYSGAAKEALAAVKERVAGGKK